MSQFQAILVNENGDVIEVFPVLRETREKAMEDSNSFLNYWCSQNKPYKFAEADIQEVF